MPGNELVQSLGRGLDLLRLVGESAGGLGLAGILVASGLKRPTAHNLLRTLVDRGFLLKDGGAYRLGPAVFRLVADDSAQTWLAEAERAVRGLAKRLPTATVSFCDALGGEVLVRFRQAPDRVLMERNSGAVLPLYQSASGLGLLAWADPEVRQALQARHPFQADALAVWGTETGMESFLAECRARGVVLPPFCRGARFRVAAVPALSCGGRRLGILGAAWHVVAGAATDGTDEVLEALRAAAQQLAAESEGPAAVRAGRASHRTRRRESHTT